MQYLKEKTFSRVNSIAASKFLAIGGLATLIPFFIHIQWLTGPVINALLILALFVIGLRAAVFIALIPSVVALSAGLLPALLAPMVPFIMLSNILFVLSIDFLHDKFANKELGYWASILISAFLKFALLFFSVSVISKLLIKSELAVKVAQILSWPQFYTAVLGGIIAYVILKFLKK
ncbi:iron hydrogenase [Candidatus Parcubacteria bacterium]|nr:MAG: iron hydrogenase [Candidatus Parcubacteria bacterium]